jgi:hypothetical protein
MATWKNDNNENEEEKATQIQMVYIARIFAYHLHTNAQTQDLQSIYFIRFVYYKHL